MSSWHLELNLNVDLDIANFNIILAALVSHDDFRIEAAARKAVRAVVLLVKLANRTMRAPTSKLYIRQLFMNSSANGRQTHHPVTRSVADIPTSLVGLTAVCSRLALVAILNGVASREGATRKAVRAAICLVKPARGAGRASASKLQPVSFHGMQGASFLGISKLTTQSPEVLQTSQPFLLGSHRYVAGLHSSLALRVLGKTQSGPPLNSFNLHSVRLGHAPAN